MMLHFHIRYKTHYGQSVVILIPGEADLPLTYTEDDWWEGSLDTAALSTAQEELVYRYAIREANRPDLFDHCAERIMPLKKIDEDNLVVVDDWQEFAYFGYVHGTKPFTDVFQGAKGKELVVKNPTHWFEVHAGQLPDDKILCICGSGKKLNNWDMEKPILLRRKKGSWQVKLNLSKDPLPIEYKFGVYDVQQEKCVYLEEGNNRTLSLVGNRHVLHYIRAFTIFPGMPWKGAGVNVQLSSLKTAGSWGIGDFTDLNVLTDWTVKCGLKMIQLLPINDTIAFNNKKDSYPYSAISAFALHPAFLNVDKLAHAAGVTFPPEMQKEARELNALGTLDYEAVAPLKRKAIALVFEKEKHSFRDDFGYFDFFDLNRHWLVPYAAFCYLRDKYNTADYSQWGEYSVYDEDTIQALVSVDQPHYDAVAIHYFTQYHLHLQLLDAVQYAHKKEVILKGDLPIGVGRHSVDTWMYPHLFHMDMQAGAPPDAFATKGQNWSFPTYNWEIMQHDDFAWWRQRMEHMSNYFDAIRIDHVLGFFRIWSIPLHAVEGIFGRFVPAIPLRADDFNRAGLYFDEFRFCEPYIHDEVIRQFFGDQAQWAWEHVIEGNRIRPAFATQQLALKYFEAHPDKASFKPAVFDLLSNVILLRDDDRPGAYHFRIGMAGSLSFAHLPEHDRRILERMYNHYFFELQNGLWSEQVQAKLDAIQKGSTMLICAEDLGMVPDMVEDVLKGREMLSLQVQRMPKASTQQFAHPADAPYLSVVTPSTHDMSTLREWWEEDSALTQQFYNQQLGHYGGAPYYAEPWICREILNQHLHAPAMWAVFLLQDLMAINAGIRRENPLEERINVPANPDHYWNYRMHLPLEDLLDATEFCSELKQLVAQSGR